MSQALMRCLVVILGFTVAGCAPLGLATPESTDQGIVYGYTTVASVRSSATALLDAKVIGSDEAQTVQGYANTARTGLDTARKFLTAGLVERAAASLAAAKGVLATAQTFLNNRKGAQ